MRQLPARVRVRIEVARGSFVKRGESRLEFVSPIPCPFNYGSVVGIPGGDGDLLDAIVLGATLRRGDEVEVPVVGIVRFRDNGLEDDKVVCGTGSWRGVASFFRVYAWARWGMNVVTGRLGHTSFDGVYPAGSSSISMSGIDPGTGGGS